MQCMSDIEDDRQIVACAFHYTEAQHVYHEVIVTHACAAIAKNKLVITGFFEFLNDILHLRWAEKLWFFYVNRFACLSKGDYQIGLASQEGWKLKYISYFGYWRRLVNFVNICDDWNIEFRFYLFEDPEAFLQTWSAVRVDRGTVSLIEAGFKYVWDPQLLSDAHIFSTCGQGKLFGLKNVNATEENERQRVGTFDARSDFQLSIPIWVVDWFSFV